MPVSRNNRIKKHRSKSSQTSRKRQRINRERKKQEKAILEAKEYFNGLAKSMGLSDIL